MMGAQMLHMIGINSGILMDLVAKQYVTAT